MVATLGTQVVVVRLNAAASTALSATTLPVVLVDFRAVPRSVVDMWVESPASQVAVGVTTPLASTGKACTWPAPGLAIEVSSYSDEVPPATEIGATGAATALER